MVELTQVPEQQFTPEDVEATLAAAVADAEEIIAEAEAEAEIEAAVEAVEKELLAENDASAEQDEEEESEDESDYDDEDDFDPNESIKDRIVALKEILTPSQRQFLISGVSTTTSGVKAITQKFGSGLWYLTTTGLLLGVPLAISILGETQLMELEKELGGMGGQAAAAAAAAPAPAEAK